MFNWDNEFSSKKLTVEDDQLTIKVKDGSGFKTSVGDQVRLILSVRTPLTILIYLPNINSPSRPEANTTTRSD